MTDLQRQILGIAAILAEEGINPSLDAIRGRMSYSNRPQVYQIHLARKALVKSSEWPHPIRSKARKYKPPSGKGITS